MHIALLEVYAQSVLMADQEGWVAQARKPSLDAAGDGLVGLAAMCAHESISMRYCGHD
jgi:hypothetical protein